MIAQGPWLANFINRYNPRLDYAAAPLPVDAALFDAANPLGMVEADVLIIPRGARNPEAAFEFVKFTQRADVQEQLAREHTKSSPMAVWSDAFRNGHPNRYVHVHDLIARSERVCILPQTTVWKSYAHLTEGVFDSAWKGGDVTSLCASAHERVQAMLDRDAMLRLRREGNSQLGAKA
jgi:ABC-type glycerol-3-phosphate transport system substrate-binding protein